MITRLLAVVCLCTAAFAQTNVIPYCVDAGSTDTYTCNLTFISVSGSTSVALQAYTAGLAIWFKPNTANTGNATVNINGKGAKTITMESGAALVDNTLVGSTGDRYLMYYDGTNFRVLGSSRALPNATSKEQQVLTSLDGVEATYSRFLALPKTGTQAITGTSTQIAADSSNVTIDANGTYSLCNASGVVTAGTYADQWISIYNADTSLTTTLQDEANCPGSLIRNGGTNVTIGPRQTTTIARWSGSYWAFPATGGGGTDRTIFNYSGAGSTVSASTTSYISLTGGSAVASTENTRVTTIPSAGTLSRWHIRTSNGQSGTGAMTCTVRVNEAVVSNTLSITLSAGAAAGTFADNTNTVTVAENDRVSAECVNAATSASANIVAMSMVFTF
jgi:hypothetical protein